MPQMRDTPPSRPDPDPTTLTTQQLRREIEMLREIVDTRFEGNDKAIALLQNAADKSPTIREVHLQTEEKFKSVEKQFIERDVRIEQTSKDSKLAIDAALAAQKEAVAKTEASFTKQIDSTGVLIQTNTKAADEKIDDLKTRLNTIEGRSKGSSDLWGYMIGGLGLLIAAAVFFTKTNPPL